VRQAIPVFMGRSFQPAIFDFNPTRQGHLLLLISDRPISLFAPAFLTDLHDFVLL